MTPQDQPTQAYPHDLARLVALRWADAPGLPKPVVLDHILSTCFHASLLHDEGRPINFRLAIAEPDLFAASDGPPAGLHRLLFDEPRPFEADELRRLVPAASFHRSLVGVHFDGPGEPKIWGLVHSGPRWLQSVRGGRRIRQTVPPVLMTAVTGPGRVLVSRGTTTVAALRGGTLVELATDVFSAPWLALVFRGLHDALSAKQVRSPAGASGPRAALEPEFGQRLVEHVLRRIVATVRGARHGGTLIFLPAESAQALCDDRRIISTKYRIRDEEPRRRLFSLTVQIMSEIARLHVRSPVDAGVPIRWSEYEASGDARLTALDEALFEAAHLVATLAQVDGAVVMTDRLEVMGFGAEISGALSEVSVVDRSLDLQGTQRLSEPIDRFGTRHRSSYRLCQHLHEALVIVVSQDGGVRFVRWLQGQVTYFDQIATGPWEV